MFWCVCREQKDRFLEKAQAESAFAPLEDVEGYLAQFVAKRPDLFGSVDDHAVGHFLVFSVHSADLCGELLFGALLWWRGLQR